MDFIDNTIYSSNCNGNKDNSAVKPPNNTALLDAKVYPNPANSMLNIEVQLPHGQVYEMCVYNTLGEKVICDELDQDLTILPINNLSLGMYYYRITSPNGALIKADKVMIVH
jgi:hypothetical protein